MLREVFLEPTWREGQDAPAAPEPRQVSAVPAYRPPVDRSRLEEPADDRAALLSARLLLSASPPANPSALHWSRRPAAPHPPAFLTRAVQPKDLLTFGDQSAARGAGYAARGDWRRAFRSYVVGAEILRQLLAGDEPSQELRDRARRRLEVVLSIAEELKQAHPDLLLLSPSRRASEVAIARAWGDVDASTAGAQAVLAGEENRAGNALFKAGCGPIHQLAPRAQPLRRGRKLTADHCCQQQVQRRGVQIHGVAGAGRHPTACARQPFGGVPQDGRPRRCAARRPRRGRPRAGGGRTACRRTVAAGC